MHRGRLDADVVDPIHDSWAQGVPPIRLTTVVTDTWKVSKWQPQAMRSRRRIGSLGWDAPMRLEPGH